jgi:GntR family transcriptional regulator, rspAB operon transcriptional repressor
MTQIHLYKRDTKLSSLADQVYEYLRLAIISAKVAPAEKLVEMDIAQQMNTSQGPVREALQRLERDGLVERKARSATFVTQIPTDEMYELFAVRANIETFAIRRTARKISPEQCAILDDFIQIMEDAGRENDIIRLAEYDMEFHRSVVEWSESKALLRIWTALSNQIERFIVQSHPVYDPDYVEVATRHNPIVRALRQGDSDGAARAVQDHIMLIWPKINL